MLTILFPFLLVFLVVIFPNLHVLYLTFLETAELIFCLLNRIHDHHFLPLFKIDTWQSAMVELDIAKVSGIFWFFFVKTCQIHVIVGSFEEDGTIKVKVKIEKRYVVGVSEVLKRRDGHFSQFKHHIPSEFEQHLRRSELSISFDLSQNIIYFHVYVLKSPFSLKTQTQQCVRLCLC